MSQDSTTPEGVETGDLDRDALLLKFIKELVDARYTQIVDAADAIQLTTYAESGKNLTNEPRFQGMPLGTRTVARPKPKLGVSDVTAFESWAASGGHGEWTFVVDDGWKKSVLRYAKWDEKAGQAVTRGGEIIPGVTLVPAPPPSSVRQTVNAETFAVLEEMLRKGEFTADLRALAPAPEGEDEDEAA
ncbi:hypothetical protein [Streptomyces sp. NPDC001536]|uniref:hypothetical protein n=1 Tax=Streptomyces sp. NPDC001536 TaxID=3364583 RepID=UPI0036AC404B